MNNPIKQVEDFMRTEFTARPHYSFNNASIMIDHSCLVKGIGIRIADKVPCDRVVVAIGALLHDIGKTYESDPEDLHTNHEKYNLIVSKELLGNLGLPRRQLALLEKVVSCQPGSVETRVVKDADALALYADKRLYMLYLKWAVEKGLDWAIERKLKKFDRLNFDVSKEIGREWFENMQRDWTEYMG